MNQDEVNLKKKEIQKEALKAWADNNFVGAIEMATGTGKSRIGVIAAFEFIKRGQQLKRSLITCSKVNLAEINWPKEIVKWGYGDFLHRSLIECHQTSYKRDDDNFEVIVVDEGHKALTSEYKKLFQLPHSKILILSAKFSKANKEILQELQIPIVYTYSIEQARADGIVSNILNLQYKIELSDEERVLYNKLCDTIDQKALNITKTANRDKDSGVWNIANSWKDSDNPLLRNLAFAYIKAVGARKQFLVNSTTRAIEVAEMIKFIIENKEDAKVIVFGEVIAPIQTIESRLRDFNIAFSSYHSKATSAKNASELDVYRKGFTQVLLSAKALIEGVDIPEANVGIVMSQTSSLLDSIQRQGRVSRYMEGKESMMIYLSTMTKGEDTQDIAWINRSGVKIDKTIDCIDDLIDLL